MKLTLLPKILPRVAFLIISGCLLSSSLIAQDKKRENKGWSELSEKDQKQLREALRTVWSDPTVLSARENVNRSAQEYHKAVRETIKKQSPETAALLDKVQGSQSGFLHTAMGGGKKRHPHGPLGRLALMIAPLSMMEKMNDDQKARFKEAGEKARRKPNVVQAFDDLKDLTKEDEAMRVKRLGAFRKVRRVYFDAVVEIAPELKEFIPPPGAQPMPFGGKGKDHVKGFKKRPPKQN